MAKKNLVIVESPAKAKTIGKYLGRGYTVTASMGHLRDLPKSKLGVDIENDFEPDYKPIKGKEALIKELKRSAKESDVVYLATDPDREGEAISWHLKALLDLDDEKAKRVTFNEITKKVVSESIQEPRAIDQDLVDAQQARRILDRIVGYQLSPLLWKKVRRGLSAGRVQSVAMRMVDDREKEIDAFKPEEYWTLEAALRDQPKNKPFIAHYYGKAGKKVELNSQAAVDAVVEDTKSAAFEVNAAAGPGRLDADRFAAHFRGGACRRKDVHSRPLRPELLSAYDAPLPREGGRAGRARGDPPVECRADAGARQGRPHRRAVPLVPPHLEPLPREPDGKRGLRQRQR